LQNDIDLVSVFVAKVIEGDAFRVGWRLSAALAEHESFE
jgi:hypothetical protein